MIKDSLAQVRPDTGASTRLLWALAAWRRRVAERRRTGLRHLDRLSDHMRKDIGFSRWDPEWQVTDWLYYEDGPGGIRVRPS